MYQDYGIEKFNQIFIKQKLWVGKPSRKIIQSLEDMEEILQADVLSCIG